MEKKLLRVWACKDFVVKAWSGRKMGVTDLELYVDFRGLAKDMAGKAMKSKRHSTSVRFGNVVLKAKNIREVA
jgi:hypothetical protein